MDLLGKRYTDEEFEKLCFEFGIELDEVTSEKNMALKERGALGDESDDIIYKIDLPANRYDLLSLEGLVQALNIFNRQLLPPIYHTSSSDIIFSVDENVLDIRNVLVGAVVKNLEMNQDVFDSFIELQDKIHQNIGRKRSLVSIGTHDLDTIEGPFLYTAMEPSKLKFVALNQSESHSASELMDLYEESYLKPYLHLLKGKPMYPVILDKNGHVLSMPPIINGDKSKISLKTKNILIEVTATDREKATIALDTIVTMLLGSVASKNKYEVESIQIVYPNGEKYTTPNLTYHEEKLSLDYINRSLGTNLDINIIMNLLSRMGLSSQETEGGMITVGIPPTRHDIINSCDVMEDVGIAYGYDNIKRVLPSSSTISEQVPLNKLSDQLRNEVARCGFTEALNFSLCPEKELCGMLRKSSTHNLVKIQNPKTIEFQVARSSLLPGLLRTIGSNKKMPLPLKLFEVGDIVITDDENETGAKNLRRLAAIYYGKKSSKLELIHGLLDRLMKVMEIPYIGDKEERQIDQGYYVEGCQDSLYLEGRSANIILNGSIIGSMGILHPEVLSNFELNMPSSFLEIDVESFPFVKKA